MGVLVLLVLLLLADTESFGVCGLATECVFVCVYGVDLPTQCAMLFSYLRDVDN